MKARLRPAEMTAHDLRMRGADSGAGSPRRAEEDR